MASRPYLDSHTHAPAAPFRRQGRSIAGVSHKSSALRALGDMLVILLAAVAAVLFRVLLSHDASHGWASAQSFSTVVALSPADVFYLICYLVAYLLFASHFGLYAQLPLRNGAHETRVVTQTALLAGVVLCGVLYWLHDVSVSRLLVLFFILFALVALVLRRSYWRYARYRNYAQGAELRNVAILGCDRLSAALGLGIEKHYRLGYRNFGHVQLSDSAARPEIASNHILGGLEELRSLVQRHFLDELIIVEPCSTEQAVRLIEQARELDVDLRAIAGYFPDLAANAPRESLAGYPMVTLHRRKRSMTALLFKRLLDIVLSAAALLFLTPILMAIMIAVLIEDGRPVFYVSERIGKRGVKFPCFKFRTMVRDAEARKKELAELNERDGILFKVKEDPRITRVGRLLRKYSFDELPQFFNVLRGEMSLVGPRPPIASEVERYEFEHLRRLEVKPGLTGLWQVQARQDASFERYIALDTAYVENWSFWLDLTILLRTVGVVISGTGS